METLHQLIGHLLIFCGINYPILVKLSLCYATGHSHLPHVRLRVSGVPSYRELLATYDRPLSDPYIDFPEANSIVKTRLSLAEMGVPSNLSVIYYGISDRVQQWTLF